MVRQPIVRVVRGVNLAKSRSPKTVLPKMQKKARQVVGRRRAVQPIVAVVVAVLSAEDAGPTWGTYGILGIGPSEPHTLLRQPVHVGSDGLRMAFITRTRRLVL